MGEFLMDISIILAGEAGDGVRAAGNLLGRIFNRHGLYSFVRDDYQSLIRGGHNFSQVRVSDERVWSQRDEAHIVVAMDERSINNHRDRITSDGLLIFDSEEVEHDSEKSCQVPLSSMVEEAEGVPIMRNSAGIGAIAYLLGLDMEIVRETMKDFHGDRAEENLVLLDKGREFAEKNLEKIEKVDKLERESAPLLSGNEAISLGAAKAGLDVYIAYPMTPSTSILHFTAAHEDELGLTVYQPENEIGVVNMSLGSAYAGARTMISSSGGGFSLMEEATSLAGMSESPILIVECQRTGPSTGVPTYTAQSDLGLALNPGQGEYPLIVLAPGDQEEAFYRAGEALNLAWRHQVPIILLSDKHLSESRTTAQIEPEKVQEEGPKIADNPEKDYERYQITEDGVSPLAFPGTEDMMVKTTSYEHRESGYTTENPEEIVEMQDKRMKKWEGIKNDVSAKNPVNMYGDQDSENLILGWGSTKGAILEAIKIVDLPIKYVQPIYLKPFPAEKVKKHMDSAGKIVAVENNATGLLADLVKKETLQSVDEKILKYDARPFNPADLAEKIEEVLA